MNLEFAITFNKERLNCSECSLNSPELVEFKSSTNDYNN